MAAHDDDQNLMTIRIPRRAAAMYAAEQDVASARIVVRLKSFVPYAAGFIFAVIAIANIVGIRAALIDGDLAQGLAGAVVGLFFFAAAALSIGVGVLGRAAYRRRGLL